MKRCPSCGQETRDDSQEFCTRCGAYFVTGHQGPAKIGQTGMDMPEDPVERGMALMDVGSFGEAVRIWDGALRSGTVVDDITYRRMVDSAAGCMLGTVMQPQMYASAAIPEMYRQAGPPVWGEDGMLRRGLMVRHLVLPGSRKDSEKLLRWLAGALPPEKILLSLMSQYTPYRELPFKALNRRTATFEYNWVRDLAVELGFSGYGQERTSAKEEYTPPFDLTGVEGKELEE